MGGEKRCRLPIDEMQSSVAVIMQQGGRILFQPGDSLAGSLNLQLASLEWPRCELANGLALVVRVL